MVKTQVQLPDHLYREGKRIAAEYEMSFADVVRRGLEGIIPSFPPRGAERGDWTLPRLNVGLSCDPFADVAWRERAWMDSAEAPRPARRVRARRA